MLGNAQVIAVVAVADLERGKEFYGGTLGLEPTDWDEPDGIVYGSGGGTAILVYRSSFAGTNQATAASWMVDDIEAEIAELKAKGITFEQYDIPGITRDGDVHSFGGTGKAAWFKDPEGNILNISSR